MAKVCFYIIHILPNVVSLFYIIMADCLLSVFRSSWPSQPVDPKPSRIKIGMKTSGQCSDNALLTSPIMQHGLNHIRCISHTCVCVGFLSGLFDCLEDCPRSVFASSYCYCIKLGCFVLHIATYCIVVNDFIQAWNSADKYLKSDYFECDWDWEPASRAILVCESNLGVGGGFLNISSHSNHMLIVRGYLLSLPWCDLRSWLGIKNQISIYSQPVTEFLRMQMGE